MSPDDEKELLQRSRRTETRLTQLMIGLGIATESQKPAFDKQPGEHATVVLPSVHTSWKEIIEAVPKGFSGRVILQLQSHGQRRPQRIGQLDI